MNSSLLENTNLKTVEDDGIQLFDANFFISLLVLKIAFIAGMSSDSEVVLLKSNQNILFQVFCSETTFQMEILLIIQTQTVMKELRV